MTALPRLVVASSLLLASCAGEPAAGPRGGAAQAAPPDGPLVVYSAWAEEVVAPLLAPLRAAGTDVEVRYGDGEELLAALLEEGTRTAADVFLAEEATALGTLSRRGLLRELPMDVVERVAPGHAGVEQRHDWVALSARVRVLVYDRAALAPEELPRSLEELGDPRFRGRFGLAPASAGLAAQLAVYRVVRGADALDALLAGLRDNVAQSYPDEAAVVRAVAQGEVGWGLAGHQELRWAAEGAERLGLAVLREGAAAGFAARRGAGVLSDDPRAVALLRFLLGAEAQGRLAAATGEVPLAVDAPVPQGALALPSLQRREVDGADVAAVLGETRRAMRRSGLLR